MGVVVPSMSSKIARISVVKRLEVMTAFLNDAHELQVAMGIERKMGKTEADRKKLFINATFGVLRRPTSLVLEQTDGSNPPIGAKIEPVPRTARNANKISRLDFYADYPTGPGVNMEHSVTRDNESHLVFVMPVLTIKLRQHFIQPGRIRTNINYVSGDIAAASF